MSLISSSLKCHVLVFDKDAALIPTKDKSTLSFTPGLEQLTITIIVEMNCFAMQGTAADMHGHIAVS
jgi:hypothetical protein